MKFDERYVRYRKTSDLTPGMWCYFADSYIELKQTVENDQPGGIGVLEDIDDTYDIGPFKRRRDGNYFVFIYVLATPPAEFDPSRVRFFPETEEIDEIRVKGLPVYGANYLFDLKKKVEDKQEAPGFLQMTYSIQDYERPFAVLDPNGEDLDYYAFIYIAEDYKDDV